MRQGLLVLTLGLSLTACSSSGGPEPSATPSATAAVPTSSPATSGPPRGQAVPIGAFVAATDLGPGWTATAATPLPCPPKFMHSAIASRGLSEARGTLTETVATGVDVATAVTAWTSSLRACGYGTQPEALGDAGVRARSADGEDTVLVTGTEGVLLVLHAHGALARAADEMDSWADLALGTSCVAAADGCH